MERQKNNLSFNHKLGEACGSRHGESTYSKYPKPLARLPSQPELMKEENVYALKLLIPFLESRGRPKEYTANELQEHSLLLDCIALQPTLSSSNPSKELLMYGLVF
uniref:Uncharacterized protein n=1 Tax=Cucumis sativus TaxID=3659 RepID=A0A0A0KW13_CUCSA